MKAKHWNYVFHASRLLAALIIVQTLYFKFGAAPESVELFDKLWAEPRGRVGSGIIELIAVLFLVYPKTALAGAYLATLIMLWAVIAHLAVLWVDSLFLMALITLAASLLTIVIVQKNLHVTVQK